MFRDKPAFTHVHYVAAMLLLLLGLVTYDLPKIYLEEQAKLHLELIPIETEPLVSGNDDFGVTEEDYWNGRHMEEVARRISKVYGVKDYGEVLRVVQLADEHASKNGIDVDLVLAVIATESSFNPKALSHVGAKGYMQVVPKWHGDKIKGRDIWNTAVNIEVGTKYLAECINSTGSLRGGLARYNGATNFENVEAYNNSVNSNRRAAKRWLASI